MRAALFADQLFYKQPGGIGTYITNLVPGMAGVLEGDLLVLVHHGRAGERLFAGLEGVEEKRLPWRRDVTGVSWHTLGLPKLEGYLGELDLVHTPALIYPPSRAPLVATVHDLIVLKYPAAFPSRWRHFHRRGLSLILRHASVIMCDSRSTFDDLCTLEGERDPRLRVVPMGVRPPPEVVEDEIDAVLEKFGLQPGFLLFVGTLEPRKNLPRLVEAYSSLSEDERSRCGQLVLAGAKGWIDEGELSRLRSRPGVRFLGYLPQDELEALYRAASVFVYPSLYEGFGLPVLEAMARGLPVVTSETSSMRELGEETALLVDPLDGLELRRAITRLVEDAALREELSARGRERARGFTWERTAELTLQAYRDAARG